MEESNYIVVLCIENEYKLLQLMQKADYQDILYSIFKEPDIDNQVTAITLEPGEKSKKLCKNLKLALSY